MTQQVVASGSRSARHSLVSPIREARSGLSGTGARDLRSLGEGDVVRVLVVDDDELFRASVCALLLGEGQADVVGEARDGEEAVRLATSLSPDVVVMDIDMPRMDGLTATREIRGCRPLAQVVVLTGSSSEARRAEAAAAGASAFLVKDELAELETTLLDLRRRAASAETLAAATGKFESGFYE